MKKTPHFILLMRTSLTLPVLFLATMLLSACQSQFMLSVEPKTQSAPTSASIYTQLNAILTADGFQSVKVPPDQSSQWTGYWIKSGKK
ncbi:MAG TPA: hypothetical protein VMI53_08605, partial [Opitutaceae bacterium]|nr:hypothetical protein [Opitutaceae bacterium]